MRFGWLRGKVQVISACCTFLQKRMQHYAYKQGSIRDNCSMISEIRITPQKERIQWTAVRYPREAQHPPKGQRDRSREPTPASSRLLKRSQEMNNNQKFNVRSQMYRYVTYIECLTDVSLRQLRSRFNATSYLLEVDILYEVWCVWSIAW